MHTASPVCSNTGTCHHPTTHLFLVTEWITTILSYEEVTRYLPFLLHCRQVITLTWLLVVSMLLRSIALSMILNLGMTYRL